jgi:hypothetical protein
MATQEGHQRIGPVGVDDLERASQAGAPDPASAAISAVERAAIARRRAR